MFVQPSTPSTFENTSPPEVQLFIIINQKRYKVTIKGDVNSSDSKRLEVITTKLALLILKSTYGTIDIPFKKMVINKKEAKTIHNQKEERIDLGKVKLLKKDETVANSSAEKLFDLIYRPAPHYVKPIKKASLNSHTPVVQAVATAPQAQDGNNQPIAINPATITPPVNAKTIAKQLFGGIFSIIAAPYQIYNFKKQKEKH